MNKALLFIGAGMLAAGQLSAQCPTGQTEVTVSVVTDMYGSETTWQVTGVGGSPVFASGGPYTNAGSAGEYDQPSVTFCVADGTPVVLTVDDEYGDGMCCAYGEGAITISAAGYDLLSLGEFGASASGSATIGGLDLAVQSVNLYPYIGQGNQTISGTLRNAGTVPVTSFTLNYTIDGGTAVSEVVTATVNPGSTYDYSHGTPWNAVVGSHNVLVSVSAPNGNGTDLNDANNSVTQPVGVATQVVPRKTLVEEFTSSTCAPCANFNSTFDPTLESLNTNTAGSVVAAVKYQMNWPSPGNDPSYNPDGNSRKNYYGVNGIPAPFLDGRTMLYGTAAELNGSAEIPAVVNLDIQATRVGTNVTVNVGVTPYTDITGTHKLHIAVVEDFYSYPQSTTSQDEFHFAMRKMLPNASGTSVTNLTSGVTQNFTQSYTFNEGGPAQGNYNLWGTIEGITVVAFLQNQSTKAVLQAGTADAVVGLDELADPLGLAIYPNPSNGMVFLRSEKNLGALTVDVFNALGERVVTRTLNGNGIRSIDLGGLTNGMYYMNVTANGVTTAKKILLDK